MVAESTYSLIGRVAVVIVCLVIAIAVVVFVIHVIEELHLLDNEQDHQKERMEILNSVVNHQENLLRDILRKIDGVKGEEDESS